MNDFDTCLFFALRAIPALMAGLILGAERSLTHPTWVGIKTIVSVSLGSCLFSTLGFYLQDKFPELDATRIVPAIVTGVGFLGAGAIFHTQGKVSGLSSAAMIWTSCAMGVMAGAGLFWVPIFSSFTLVIIMMILRKIERYLNNFNK